MRARNIKPGFFKNEFLAECSPSARLLFIGLWMLADREGRLEYRPKRWKGELFPYESVDITSLFSELESVGGLVLKYAADNVEYVWIPHFLSHQKPHQNESASTIPPYTCDHGAKDLLPRSEALPTKEPPAPAESLLLNPESGLLDKNSFPHGEDRAVGNGGDIPPLDEPHAVEGEPHEVGDKTKSPRSGKKSKQCAVGDEVEFYLTKKKRKLTGKRLLTFKRFWEAFGYFHGKAEAADAWFDIPTLTESLVETILVAARREAMARPSLIANGKSPKWAQGWITARRWEDEHGADHELTPEEQTARDIAEAKRLRAQGGGK